jgi:hypothetical protein
MSTRAVYYTYILYLFKKLILILYVSFGFCPVNFTIKSQKVLKLAGYMKCDASELRSYLPVRDLKDFYS